MLTHKHVTTAEIYLELLEDTKNSNAWTYTNTQK